MEIVTYANKSMGTLEELINHKYKKAYPIKWLGKGNPWNGYSDKSKGLLKYIKNKKDDDIIVMVDGFDTKINKNPDKIVKLFEEYNCKVLVSNDAVGFRNGIGRIMDLVFGNCRNDHIANAGLYMGYVKYLKEFLNDAINHKCTDDQIVLNTLCKKYDFIAIDTENKVFENFYASVTQDNKSSAIIVSYPGTPGFLRYIRAVGEYLQFAYI